MVREMIIDSQLQSVVEMGGRLGNALEKNIYYFVVGPNFWNRINIENHNYPVLIGTLLP